MSIQRRPAVGKKELLACILRHIKTTPNADGKGFTKNTNLRAVAAELDMDLNSLTTRVSNLRTEMYKLAVAKFTQQYVAANDGKQPVGPALAAIQERASLATIPEAVKGSGAGRPKGDKTDEYLFIDMMTGETSSDPNGDESGESDETGDVDVAS